MFHRTEPRLTAGVAATSRFNQADPIIATGAPVFASPTFRQRLSTADGVVSVTATAWRVDRGHAFSHMPYPIGRRSDGTLGSSS